ncbi:adenylyl cyclase-associated protein [Caerostris extrusa]|uniref:Adenylyl cyclase-associated protein n=1 Tax=Caerostris extrusa TaxID=172846 RepID=A0AAV4VI75_CAEEX|nr:adenylyl cyclase-associated protein [Caerostris extrusa]
MAVAQRAISDFEQLINTSLQNFAGKVSHAFQRNLELIKYGLYNPQPPMDNEQMKTYANEIRSIVEFRESPKDSSFTNHFSTVREAILALGWINVKPAPTQYIKDAKEAGEYYGNRVLSSNKGNELHKQWVNSWNQLLMDLQSYVKSNFLTGFTWGSGQGKGGAAPPPPPPPPPPALFADAPPQGDNARQALLNDLNQGANITSYLKPVKKDKTAGGAAPVSLHSPVKVQTAPRPAARPPKFALDGRKWVVEYQRSQYGLRVENEDMSQSLAMFSCQDISLEVANKLNSVVIDSCKNSLVVLKSIISSVEVIRCDRLKIQCDGIVPLINMDNCDSVQIFVTPASRGVEVISSKTTSCNMCLLEPDGDYKEIAMPEQIKTVLVGEKLVSSVVEKN